MKEIRTTIDVSAMKSPPKIWRGILKMGCPWRTWFEGRASAYDARNTAKTIAPIICVKKANRTSWFLFN